MRKVFYKRAMICGDGVMELVEPVMPVMRERYGVSSGNHVYELIRCLPYVFHGAPDLKGKSLLCLGDSARVFSDGLKVLSDFYDWGTDVSHVGGRASELEVLGDASVDVAFVPDSFGCGHYRSGVLPELERIVRPDGVLIHDCE